MVAVALVGAKVLPGKHNGVSLYLTLSPLQRGGRVGVGDIHLIVGECHFHQVGRVAIEASVGKLVELGLNTLRQAQRLFVCWSDREFHFASLFPNAR